MSGRADEDVVVPVPEALGLIHSSGHRVVRVEWLAPGQYAYALADAPDHWLTSLSDTLRVTSVGTDR